MGQHLCQCKWDLKPGQCLADKRGINYRDWNLARLSTLPGKELVVWCNRKPSQPVDFASETKPVGTKISQPLYPSQLQPMDQSHFNSSAHSCAHTHRRALTLSWWGWFQSNSSDSPSRTLSEGEKIKKVCSWVRNKDLKDSKKKRSGEGTKEEASIQLRLF